MKSVRGMHMLSTNAPKLIVIYLNQAGSLDEVSPYYGD